MTTAIATAAEVENNFGHYLQSVQDGGEIIILQNGREVARLVSRSRSVSFLSDALTGVLKRDYDDKAVRAERIAAHENIEGLDYKFEPSPNPPSPAPPLCEA